jgi:SAM-dependent methyltransferase
MPGFMNPAEFANIAGSEQDFWWYRGMRDIFFRFVEPYVRERKLTRVLEAGCGTGYFSRLLQTSHRWPVTPVDISWDGLAYARKMGVERPVQSDICSLPFASGAFDLVLSIDVLPHLPRGVESQAAAEFARVLKPGGLLVVRAAALDLLRSRHSAFAYERQRFTRRRMIAMTEAASMRVLRCTYLNSLLLPLSLFKFRVWEPLMRQPAASGVQPVAPWLDRLLYSALALESRWIGAGHGFPAGQSLLLVGEKL